MVTAKPAVPASRSSRRRLIRSGRRRAGRAEVRPRRSRYGTRALIAVKRPYPVPESHLLLRVCTCGALCKIWRTPIADGAHLLVHHRALTGHGGEWARPRAASTVGRLEALKILPESVSADPSIASASRVKPTSPPPYGILHVVAVQDRGEHEGQLRIAMDYVEGTDAAQLRRDRYPHGMPPKDALEIVSAIADALDYAHERYLLHRDVKPANILITDPRMGDRRILLADLESRRPQTKPTA